MQETRRLTLSRDDRMLAGVCGGFGEYFQADPVLIRVIAVLLIVFTGFLPGIIAYLVVWMIMPEPPEVPGQEEPPSS